MRKSRRLLCSLAFMACVPAAAHAQAAWTGILSSGRAVDWSAGNVGVAGGIPSGSWTQCGSTIAAGASAATITAAILACPANHFVLLGPGTFTFSSGSGIDFSNHGSGNGASHVVLRGSGPNSTFLVFTGGNQGCIIFTTAVCMSGSSFQDGSSATSYNWTAGYAQGTTVISLSSTTGLSVGSLLALDQLNDTSDSGDILIAASCSGSDCGNSSNETPVFSQQGLAPGRNCSINATCRSQHQWVRVTGINGTQVTITPGLYMPNWRSSQSPQAWSPGVIGQDVSTLDGIENLSIDTSADGGNTWSNVEIGNCYQCWAKNVRSIKSPRRNHFWLYNGVRVEVRDSYMYGSQGTSQAYGVETYFSGDNLVINNIIQHTTGALEPADDAGSVFAYNFNIFDYLASPATWMIPDIDTHDAGNQMELFEGNVSNGFGADAIHGTQEFLTTFRNYFLGWQNGKTQQTIAIFGDAYNRYFNHIGNVLGQSSYHTQYQDLAPSGANPDTSVYVLGWSNTGSNCCNVANDSLVASTMMRWGNWDAVTNATRWCGNSSDPAWSTACASTSEVPTGAAKYPNAVPSSTVLPNSFFLSAMPSWWGNGPWPPIGPDISGGNISGTGGHANMIPAMACYLSSMSGPVDGSGSVLSFDANNCYQSAASGPPPAAPTNLTAVVH